jgi:hypothetical protein
MNSDLQLNDILNKKFALRSLLTNTKYHTSEASISKEDISQVKEPNLYLQVAQLAKQIVDNPNIILSDSYDILTRKSDWISLKNKEVLENGIIIPIDARSRPGHKILDNFMQHFWDVRNHKGTSVRSLCTQENLEQALLKNICMHSTPYKSEIRKMLTMYGAIGNVTKYRTVTSKAITQLFDAHRVFDPCVGWGGRMLGCLSASDDIDYIGCEPDTQTYKGLIAILKDEAIPEDVRNRALIYNQPAEDVLMHMHKDELFDMILTSPPYFNLELYTSGEQSIIKYPTWDDWVDKWLKVVLLSCLSHLFDDGVSCWNVKNFKIDSKAYPLEDVVVKIHKDAGWTLVKRVCMDSPGRMGNNRITANIETRKAVEETLCFKKL